MNVRIASLALIASLSAYGFALSETAAPAAAAAAAAPAKKAPSFKGTVESVDAIGNTITVKGKKTTETFTLDAAGKIMQGKAELKLMDVAKGSKVAVQFTDDAGKKTATMVKVDAVKMADKKAKTDSTATPK